MTQSRFCIVPSDAVSDARLTHVQLRVLLAIGSFTGKDKAAFPKQKTIAEMLGLTRETVNRAIAALRRLGYVHVEHQHREDGGQRESLYWVKLDPIAQEPCDVSVTPPVIVSDHTPRDLVDHTARDSLDHTIRTNHKNTSTIAEAIVERTPQSTPDPEQPKRASPPRGAARGNRIAPNWAPTAIDYAFASKEGLNQEEINREADRFRDYWIAKSGRDAVKLDWSATWRNWIRSDHRKRNGSGAGNASRNGGRTDAFDRLAERLQAGSERQEAWRDDDAGGAQPRLINITPVRGSG